MSLAPTKRPAETGTAALGTPYAAYLIAEGDWWKALGVLAVSYAPALITWIATKVESRRPVMIEPAPPVAIPTPVSAVAAHPAKPRRKPKP